jgi:hypothetical protein
MTHPHETIRRWRVSNSRQAHELADCCLPSCQDYPSLPPPHLTLRDCPEIDRFTTPRARPGVSRRSPAAYLQPARPAQMPSRWRDVSPPWLRNGDMFASAPPVPAGMPAMRHPIRLPWSCWHDGGRRARRCRPGADRAQQSSTVAGAAPVADPPPRTSGTRYRWPQGGIDLACQTVPRALADTLPGRGPAGLAALIEGPATLILSTMTRGFCCGECRTRG